jgi:hypothetical protein
MNPERANREAPTTGDLRMLAALAIVFFAWQVEFDRWMQ